MHAKSKPFHHGNGTATHRPFKQLQRNPLKPVKKALLRIYEANLGHGWEYPSIEGTVEEALSYLTLAEQADIKLLEEGNQSLEIIANERTHPLALVTTDTVQVLAREKDFSNLAIWQTLHDPKNVGKTFTLTINQPTKPFYGLKGKIVKIASLVVVGENKVRMISEWEYAEHKSPKLEDIKKYFKNYTQPLFDNLGNKITADAVAETLDKWYNV